DPLTEIVRFARMAAHEVAQGPLEEQQNNDRQDQPLQAAQRRSDDAVQEVDRSAHGDRLARVRRAPRLRGLGQTSPGLAGPRPNYATSRPPMLTNAIWED